MVLCKKYADIRKAATLTVFLIGELLQGISWGVFQVEIANILCLFHGIKSLFQ